MPAHASKMIASLLACLAILSACKSRETAPAEPPADANTFTVVLLPDTQY